MLWFDDEPIPVEAGAMLTFGSSTKKRSATAQPVTPPPSEPPAGIDDAQRVRELTLRVQELEAQRCSVAGAGGWPAPGWRFRRFLGLTRPS